MGKNQNSKKSLGLPNNSLDQKINPWKIQQPQNKFSCTLFVELRDRDRARIRGYYHESSDCFEYPKIPYLDQAIQILESKISTPSPGKNNS